MHIVIQGNNQPPKIFVPCQDPDADMPPEVRAYKQKGEPSLKQEEMSYIPPSDEKALRNSVTRLALFQAKKPSPRWEETQWDCAGLVRFAYREAIRVRSPDDSRKLGIPNALYLPEVSESSRNIFADLSRIWHMGNDESYHLMIFVEDRADNLVVYHNGAAKADAQVRVVRIADLMTSPDPIWLPIANNPHFLGVYEWNRLLPQNQSVL